MLFIRANLSAYSLDFAIFPHRPCNRPSHHQSPPPGAYTQRWPTLGPQLQSPWLADIVHIKTANTNDGETNKKHEKRGGKKQKVSSESSGSFGTFLSIHAMNPRDFSQDLPGKGH